MVRNMMYNCGYELWYMYLKPHILLSIKIFDNCKIVVTHAQADC